MENEFRFCTGKLDENWLELSIEGNGVYCSQTASFTFTGPLSPLTNHRGLFTEREREKIQGTRRGRFVVSHLLLDDMLHFFMARGNDSGAVRLLLGMVKMHWKCTFIHLDWYGRDSFTVFFTRDSMEYQNSLIVSCF